MRARPCGGSRLFRFRCHSDGLRYTLTVGYFEDSRVAELFLSSAKAGSQVDSGAKDAAIIASIALQYGAPVQALRSAVLRDHLGRAITPIGSALDLLVARRIE